MTRHTDNGRPKVAAPAAVLLPVLVLMTTALRADDVVTHWNKIMLATISAAGTDPITSTRNARSCKRQYSTRSMASSESTSRSTRIFVNPVRLPIRGSD